MSFPTSSVTSIATLNTLTPMKGIQMKEIRDAMSAAYNKSSLRQMLRFNLDRELDDIVTDGPLNTMLFDLLALAEQEGWEAELVRESQRFVPGNQELAKVAEKFGWSPSMRLVVGDTTLEDTSVTSGLERLVVSGNPNLDPTLWITRMTEVTNRVCRIDILGSAQGTGWLVGPRTVLTNQHVVHSFIKGLRSVDELGCVFDYKKLSDGTLHRGSEIGVKSILVHASPTQGELQNQPDKTLPTADELDFALLELTEDFGEKPISAPQSPKRGWETLPKAPVSFVKGQGLIIVQHPMGAPIKLSVDSAAVLSVHTNNSRVRYRNNTEGGSSGSPVFDMQWNPVALHHMGDPSTGTGIYNQAVIPLFAIRAKIAAAGFGGLIG